MYEVGALAALHDALPTLDFTRLHSYVGVSAGAFVTAGLANGITPREMVQLFIENEGEDGDALSPVCSCARRCASTPARGEPARRGDGGIVGQCEVTATGRALSELQRLAARSRRAIRQSRHRARHARAAQQTRSQQRFS